MKMATKKEPDFSLPATIVVNGKKTIVDNKAARKKDYFFSDFLDETGLIKNTLTLSRRERVLR